MKISQKISLGSSILFGTIFLLFAIIIYIIFTNISNRIFYDELARTAKISGMFYLEKDELTKAQYQPIKEAFYNLNPEQLVSIYDEKDSIAFNTKNLNENFAKRLNKIRKNGKLNFKEGNYFYHGLYYKDNQGNFVVLVKSQNELIQNQLKYLIFILLIAFIIGMLVLTVLTSYLSKLAYRPIRDIIKQVNKLNLNRQPLALNYKPSKDELEELFKAFNGLLKEIERTYQQQKIFVDYASHELKTPLSSIISQLEIIQKQERTPSEYQRTNRMVYNEALRLQRILKNLLILSGLNRTIHQKEVFRIDELIWNVLKKLSTHYDSSKFKIDIQVSAKQSQLFNYTGNDTLLSIAIYNLLDNAAKFSGSHPVALLLFPQDDKLVLEIKDQGIGMSEEDLSKIPQPFFRGQNTNDFEGSGLGFSIAEKILKLHNIDFVIKSKPQKGTTITLVFDNHIKTF